MRITLINPNIVSQKDDFSGSGIPYMPVGLAYLAAFLRDEGHEVTVIDAFGAAPDRVRATATHFIQGLTAEEVAERVPEDTELIGFFAHLTVTHKALLEIMRRTRECRPDCHRLVIENVNLVNSYSLRHVAHEFFELGADFVVLGYPEYRTQRVIDAIQGRTPAGIDGVLTPDQVGDVDLSADKDVPIDSLPFPAWDLFPVENYWRLGYAHAPLTSKRYLPLLSSRGCPFNCGFCITPEVTCRRWNARSAANVVAEIEQIREQFGVREFHFQDVNPTVSRQRTQDFCRLLIERDVKVTWKLSQGTKLESLDRETIGLMRGAGCTFVSISPESGSLDVLNLMDKPVDLEHAARVIRWIHAERMYSQVCFVLGYPGETPADRQLTARYARRLARIGADEIALFIITPMPGSRIFEQMGHQVESLDQMTFTPRWREDFPELSAYRKRLYLQYFAIKVLWHPLRAAGYLWSLITGRFHTKVEMTIYRKLKVFCLMLKGRR